MDQQLDFLVDKVVAELQKKLGEMGQTAPAGTQKTEAPVAPQMVAVQKAASPGEREQLALPVEPERTAQVPNPKWQEGLNELLDSTPARIGVWRTGVRPLTKTMLQLRRDHAAAVDAVYGEVSQSLLDEFSMFTVETQYDNTENYLKRPDMGRILNEEGVRLLQERCQKKPQVQIVVSDGLSASAVDANLRDVLPSLIDSLKSYGLTCGTPFFVKGGRVASMDHIGELLQPEVLVLLIGERPGLVTAHSMSAYMCYRPRKGMVESERTVISNIHRQGTSPIEAGAHIGTILSKMLEQKASGVKLVL
ncbi:ethanolamine ammonia-lyase light chain [Brevibacillus reuszeri]|uniref:Ethanolamine ammonia-lyase small subunit n=1 Tax=Brevibacillus reuszeri TaxID=54915 RepID=A0A0K9YSP3_9BACL|nr:ethanolamine ammonia-lyase subunit EutC [Brevibacillus reuszeri]KNB71696.1 ethanolamine ammonia-lyase [Brevibacillus reuszeri]MED1855481.1 ethanolamine ammonia-lyase subunit EutC [Brevibacillus reuszeri]GED67369.1 ethanolamine ammonia-lyase light chain [Brevibacillus reuszeri]